MDNTGFALGQSPYMGYFEPLNAEEDYPIKIDIEENEKFQTLDKLSATFFEDNSLTIAKDTSKLEREKRGFHDASFVYGEVTFRSLAYIIEYVKKVYKIKKGSFYDLGSGTGRGVLIAAFCHPFTKYIGVEFLEGLYKQSLSINKQYYEKFTDYLNKYQKYMPDYSSVLDNNNNNEQQSNLPEMLMINDDLRNVPVGDASLIFINSTCFSVELMAHVSKKCDVECQEGCIVITFTKKLSGLSGFWEIKGGFKRIMSWGVATVFIHRKKPKEETYAK